MSYYGLPKSPRIKIKPSASDGLRAALEQAEKTKKMAPLQIKVTKKVTFKLPTVQLGDINVTDYAGGTAFYVSRGTAGGIVLTPEDLRALIQFGTAALEQLDTAEKV